MSTQLLVAWEGMGVYHHSLATCEVLITTDKLFINLTLKLLKELTKNPMKLPNSLNYILKKLIKEAINGQNRASTSYDPS